MFAMPKRSAKGGPCSTHKHIPMRTPWNMVCICTLSDNKKGVECSAVFDVGTRGEATCTSHLSFEIIYLNINDIPGYFP